jgi:hypothetical protein
LAHINVRWELRFHGMTRAESGEKQDLASGVAYACVPLQARSGIYPR